MGTEDKILWPPWRRHVQGERLPPMDSAAFDALARQDFAANLAKLQAQTEPKPKGRASSAAYLKSSDPLFGRGWIIGNTRTRSTTKPDPTDGGAA